MKRLFLILTAAALSSCAAQKHARTLADGKVRFPDDPRFYTAFVQGVDDNGRTYWMAWEPWGLQDVYSLAAYPGDTVRAMWIDAFTGDTLATLKVIAPERMTKKRRIIQDLVLDGTDYTIK